MIPVYQTILGEEGNCFTACLASILEVSLEDIGEIPLSDDWWEVTRRICLEYGYSPYMIPAGQRWLPEGYAPSGYCIAGGGSPRGCARGHAVVYKDGRIVHDPHPGSDGLTYIEEYYVLVPICRAEPLV